jgi:short-subunit dehydrogenase
VSPYAASKFGVRGFTESLRMELAAFPVKVLLSVMLVNAITQPEQQATGASTHGAREIQTSS